MSQTNESSLVLEDYSYPDYEGPYLDENVLRSERTPKMVRFKNRCQKLSMDMQIFTLSIFKLFCNLGDCDMKELYNFLVHVDTSCQGIINHTYQIQLHLFDHMDASVTPTEFYETDELAPTGDDPSYDDVSQGTFVVNEDPISREITANQSVEADVRDRISRLNISGESANSIREGVLNLQRTETNLRRFANFANLNDLSGFDLNKDIF